MTKTARVLPAPTDDAARLAAAVQEAVAVLRRGGLVAFPTETVYGLGANAFDESAVARIFAAKGRPSFNPLIVHLATADSLSSVASEVSPLSRRLAEAFWPGPLTLVLPRAPAVPAIVAAGLSTVGVRVPAHPVAHALLAAFGLPIAAPSANAFTRVSATTAAHVVAQLAAVVDLVLDGGAATVGIESTVVDATGERAVLLRPGAVSVAAIERVVGPVHRSSVAAAGTAPRPAPGMIDRHYAPRTPLVAFPTAERAAVERHLVAASRHGATGLVAFDVAGSAASCRIEMPRDPLGYARELYAALHQLDEAGCTIGFVEAIPDDVAWEAIADRLRRAGAALRELPPMQ